MTLRIDRTDIARSNRVVSPSISCLEAIDNNTVMSSAEQQHPIVSHLESIERRLGEIESALGIDDKPKPFLRTRTIVLIVVLLVFAGGMLFGLNYVLTRLMTALPV